MSSNRLLSVCCSRVAAFLMNYFLVFLGSNKDILGRTFSMKSTVAVPDKSIIVSISGLGDSILDIVSTVAGFHSELARIEVDRSAGRALPTSSISREMVIDFHQMQLWRL